MDLPDVPDRGLQLAFAVWLFIGMLKPIFVRAGVPRAWVRDILPLLSLGLNSLAAGLFITVDIGLAIIYGAIMTVVSAGFHDLYDHYSAKRMVPNDQRTNA